MQRAVTRVKSEQPRVASKSASTRSQSPKGAATSPVVSDSTAARWRCGSGSDDQSLGYFASLTAVERAGIEAVAMDSGSRISRRRWWIPSRPQDHLDRYHSSST